jgi:poly(ADP-ribose) glycohydrolase ARH3
VADAVAAPWEGLDAQLIYEMGPADAIMAHESRRRITYTDDTQMTIGVAEELIERGSIDGDALARRFAANYHPDRGYGQGARRIINAIGFGEDWKHLAATIFEGQGSLGNGAAMRVAPIGLFFSHDLQQVAAEAEQSALPTHTHPIGIDGARLMAVATALAVRSAGERFRRRSFLEELRRFAQTEEFQWQIDHALALEPYQSLQVFGNSLEANRSVMTSILCFADSPDDYSQAISRAIGQGNDVDTLAAMTGAIAGARLGIEAVPRYLIDCLEDEEQGKTCLLKLARTLSSQSVAK